MTEVNDTPDAGVSAEAPVVETQSTPEVTTETTGQEPQAPQGFSIPDEYKESGWASKVQGEDGQVDQDKLFKHIHNVNSLVGQKTVGLPNWENTEEVEDYFSKIRPDSPDAYKFGEEAHDVFKSSMGEAFHKAGLAPQQAASLIEAYQGLETSQREATYGDEALNQAGSEMFPDGAWEAKQDNFASLLGVLQGEGLKFESLQSVPNSALIEVVNAFDTVFNKYNVGADTNLNSRPNNTLTQEKHGDVFKEYMDRTNKGSLSSDEQASFNERLLKAKR